MENSYIAADFGSPRMKDDATLVLLGCNLLLYLCPLVSHSADGGRAGVGPH